MKTLISTLVIAWLGLLAFPTSAATPVKIDPWNPNVCSLCYLDAMQLQYELENLHQNLYYQQKHLTQEEFVDWLIWNEPGLMCEDEHGILPCAFAEQDEMVEE